MVDPEYGALVDRLIEEIQVESGVPYRERHELLGATIFLGSPGVGHALPHRPRDKLLFLSSWREDGKPILTDESIGAHRGRD